MARPAIVARIMIRSFVLNAGTATGPVLALSEPLSFWGAFDPRTGRIVDTHHPQCGVLLTQSILLMRESRGSGTAPGAIAEAIRRGTAPAAIILVMPDINLAIGAAVATRLYGKHCPVLSVSSAGYLELLAAAHITIATDGLITV
jgi:uncharacterized protein